MSVSDGYLYTKEHEWVKLEGLNARVGITEYAQKMLGDITYVELPPPGEAVKQFEVFTTVESVKVASDINAPLTGKITSVNKGLENTPELMNQAPFEGGWIVELEITNPAETANLMNAEQYSLFLKGIEG